jgi:predicted P-loop ATPase
MGKADVDHLKAFVSRMEDRYRPPYGKTVKTYPRRCIFVGTTNSNSYLQNLTGNRRFLPVQTGAIDLDALKRDRDQLWAEAGQIEAGGESLVLPENLWSEAALRQDERLANDPWVDAVKMYLVKDESRTRYSSQELLEDALGVPCNRQNQRDAKRLSAVMARLGFQHKANVRVGGLSVTGYISVDDPLFGG